MSVSSEIVARMEHILDESDAVTILADGLRTDQRGRKMNTNNLRLLLLGMFLAAHTERISTIKILFKVLEDLSLDDRLNIGFSVPDSTQPDGTAPGVTIDQMYYLSKRIGDRLAYSEASAPDITAEERARRHEVLQRLTKAVMEVFEFDWPRTHAAMDATGVWSWGRGKAKPKGGLTTDGDELDEVRKAPSPLPQQAPKAEEASRTGTTSYDPDAAWGVKTAKDGKSEVFFGYHEHTLVQMPAPGQTIADVPPLILGFELTPANTDIVDVSLRLIDAGGERITDLAIDTHYSYKRIERWKRPLTDRGIRQHLDLRSPDQGFIESDRVRWAAGWPHCPSTPDRFGTIAPPPIGDLDRNKNLPAFYERIDKRETYAFRRVTSPDPDGTSRIECPAAAGKIGCPLRAGTVETAVLLGQSVVENPPDPNGPEGLPLCCTQQTVTLTPPPGQDKLVQRFYWGSRQWNRTYGKRTHVEGSYGNRKNVSTEGLKRGHFQIVGLPWIHITMTAVNASYNLRMLQNWHKRADSPKTDHPLLQPSDRSRNLVALTDEETRDRVAKREAA